MHHRSLPLALALAHGLAAQEPTAPVGTFAITATLDRIHVDTAGGEVRVLAAGYKLVAADGAICLAPYRGAGAAAAPVTFRLVAVRRGDATLPLAAKPTTSATADRLVLDHGALREEWLWRAQDAEQRFRLTPPPGRGDLVLTLALATELQPVDVEPGIALRRGAATLVHYGDVTTIAADGDTVATAVRLDGDRLQLVVPEAFLADHPGELLVDPIVSPVAIDTGSDDVRNPEVAYEPTTATWLCVYERHFSANDIDILARRYDRDGTFREEVAVATGSRESLNPAVAANTFAQQFLVVWDEDRAFDRIILGRTRAAGGTSQGTEFVVRDAAGLTNTNPAVGGSVATDLRADHYLVLSEEGTLGMAYSAVSTRGTLTGTFTRDTTGLRRPRITKARATDQRWLCTSERGGDVFVEAGVIGGLAAGAATILSPAIDRQPTVAGFGTSFLLAWVTDDPATGIGRLAARAVRFDGVQTTIDPTPLDLRTGEPGGSTARSQSIPALASHGARFGITYRERQPTGFDRPFAAALLLPQGTPLFLQGHVSLSELDTPHGALAMVSEGDMGLPGARSLVVFDRATPAGDRDIRGVLYDAHANAEPLSFQNTHCPDPAGAPAITAVGLPLLGETLTLRLAATAVPLWVLGFPAPITDLCNPTPLKCGTAVGLPFLATLFTTDFVLTVPFDPGLLGTRLAAQGIDVLTTNGCGPQVAGLPFTTGKTVRITIL